MKKINMFKYSKNISEEIEDTVTKYTFQDSSKSILIVSLFELARQHHQSILLLIETKNYNSASALLRPLVEACYRANWCHTFATDKEIENLLNDKLRFKTLNPIAKELDRKYNVTTFSQDINILNDFTHGGIQQVFRMINKNTIKSNYFTTDLDNILEIANKNICLFLHVIGVHLDDDELIKKSQCMIMDFNKFYISKRVNHV